MAIIQIVATPIVGNYRKAAIGMMDACICYDALRGWTVSGDPAEWQRGGETAMGDLRSPRLLYLKGALFVLLGTTAAGLILLDRPNLRTALLLAVAIWAFARAYYFAFYVIEHYIDGTFKYAGLWSFVQHALRRPTPSAMRDEQRR